MAPNPKYSSHATRLVGGFMSVVHERTEELSKLDGPINGFGPSNPMEFFQLGQVLGILDRTKAELIQALAKAYTEEKHSTREAVEDAIERSKDLKK